MEFNDALPTAKEKAWNEYVDKCSKVTKHKLENAFNHGFDAAKANAIDKKKLIEWMRTDKVIYLSQVLDAVESGDFDL